MNSTPQNTSAMPVTTIVFEVVRWPMTATTKPKIVSAMNGPGRGSNLNSLPRKFSANKAAMASKVAEVSFSR